MGEDRKPKIIYITATGHSGSTILDLALSTIPNSFSVGELFDLEKFSQKDGRRDDTGSVLSESALWGNLSDNVDAYISKGCLNESKTQKALKALFPVLVKSNFQYKNYKLFSAVIQQAEALVEHDIDIVVDSSKSPLRMTSLSKNQNLDVKVIYLIRSPWGVAYSHTKNNRSLLLACWRWIRTNLIIAWHLFWRVGYSRHIRIFYEDLCAETRQELRRITNHFGLESIPESYIEKINKQTSYRFGGNSLRHQEIKEIEYDNRWREGLSFFQKALIGVLCGPLYLLFRLVHKVKK